VHYEHFQQSSVCDVVMFAASMGLHLQRIQEIHAQLASYPKKLTKGSKKSGVRMESDCTL
jgi:hypothetical protein